MQQQRPMEPETAPNRANGVRHDLPPRLRTFFLILLTLCASVTTYYRCFSNLAFYDDEGTLMAGVQRLLQGYALYDLTPSIYGPVFYLFEALPHQLTGAALSHDSVRLISTFAALLVLTLIFLIVYRLTASLPVTILAYFVSFHAIRFIGLETAHPQEVCVPLLLGLVLVADFSRPAAVGLAIGFLAGLMLLTKINLGLLAVVGTSLAFLSCWKRSPWQRACFVAAIGMALVFPFALLRAHLPAWDAVKFCLLEDLALAAAAVTLAGTGLEGWPGWRIVGAALSGYVAALAGVITILQARGTTISAMIHWLVIVPAQSFGHDIPSTRIDTAALAPALAGLGVAVYFRVRPRTTALAVWKLLFGVVALFVFIRHQDKVFEYTPSFLWLAAIDPARGSPNKLSLARRVLVWFGVVQILYAYPVGGAQVFIAALLLLIGAAVCLADSLTLFQHLPRPVVPFWRHAAPISCVLAIFGALALGFLTYRQYESLRPLDLPGASRVRVEPSLAIVRQELVQRVRQSACSSLFAVPQMFSFNMWTGVRLPERMLPMGMLGLSGQKEAEVVHELSRQPGACLIYNAEILRFWRRGRDPSREPLTLTVRRDFRTVFATSDYEFMRPVTSAQ